MTNDEKLSLIQLFKALKLVADFVPIPFYWLDCDCIVRGVNKHVLDALNIISFDFIIDKDHYAFYPKDIADQIIENTQLVITKGQTIEFEEEVVSSSGEMKIFRAIRGPLRDYNSKIIGVIGTSIEITAEKEAERLQLINEKYETEKQAQEKFRRFIDKLQNDIQNYKIEALNEKLGYTSLIKPVHNIELTKRESEILYYLSLNKVPKEISTILSILENKNVSPATIQSTITKRLYYKFEVSSISQLIEKANMLKLIPSLY